MSNSFSQFYDRLAPAYDTMTGFEKRMNAERDFFREIVSRFHIHRAVDAGCGTGVHALVLAQLGVNVLGVDISGEMIAAAKQHAEELRLSVEFRQMDLLALAGTANRYDAVFCLGNTLAHCDSAEHLRRVVEGFSRTMVAGGVIVLQVLNYDRILADRPRVINKRQVGDCTYVRYYSYHDERILFNILTLCKKGVDVNRTLLSTPLYP
ncbi:MAG: class I SAM-dependent methyltransferase, partial [Ignavibacteriales bacterium]|nr:class I SAM-dependent methyltransferase [Ignavibacteriales bacterium]